MPARQRLRAGTDCAGRRCAADRYGSSSRGELPIVIRGSREPRVRATASDARIQAGSLPLRTKGGRRCGFTLVRGKPFRWPTVSDGCDGPQIRPLLGPGRRERQRVRRKGAPVPAKSVFQAGLSVSGRLDLNQRLPAPNRMRYQTAPRPTQGQMLRARIGCGPLCVRQCRPPTTIERLPRKSRLLGEARSAPRLRRRHVLERATGIEPAT